MRISNSLPHLVCARCRQAAGRLFAQFPRRRENSPGRAAEGLGKVCSDPPYGPSARDGTPPHLWLRMCGGAYDVKRPSVIHI